jgi:hypothetical protein
MPPYHDGLLINYMKVSHDVWEVCKIPVKFTCAENGDWCAGHG